MALLTVSRLILLGMVPRGANPKWYHVLGIVFALILILAGGLGGAYDASVGNWIALATAIAIFAAGIVLTIALRRSMRKTIPGSTAQQILRTPTRPVPSTVPRVGPAPVGPVVLRKTPPKPSAQNGAAARPAVAFTRVPPPRPSPPSKTK